MKFYEFTRQISPWPPQQTSSPWVPSSCISLP